MTEPVRPEELHETLRVVALSTAPFHSPRDEVVLRLADALEAAGDGPFVIDATGRVLGTLELAGRSANFPDHPDIERLYRLRPSLTEEPKP